MTTKLAEQESLFVDYAKAIGITAVVIGHYKWNPFNIYNPYTYHMAFFFIIGGILMKPIYDIRKWIKNISSKYVLYVIIWYVVISVITIFLNRYIGSSIGSVFSEKGKMDWLTYPITHNMHNNVLFLVAWFIVSYLFATSIFKIKITLLKSYSIYLYNRSTLLILGLLVGYVSIKYLSQLYNETQYWLYNFLCQVGVGYMFVSIGYFSRQFLVFLSYIELFLLSVVIMFTFSGNGIFVPVFMAWSKYPDGFASHLFGSLTACFSLFSVAYISSKAVRNNIIKSIGIYSKDIMTLHLLAFALVDIMLSYLGYYDHSKINGINHLRPSSPNFWAIYIAFGLFFPIIVRNIIDHLMRNSQRTIRIITSRCSGREEARGAKAVKHRARH